MRLGRLANLIMVVGVVLALAGAATALAAAWDQDPGPTALAPAPVARSSVYSVTDAPGANGAFSGGPEPAPRVSADPTSPLPETSQPRTGVPSTAETPPESPTTPFFGKAGEINTGPPGADGGLETVNPSVPVEGPDLRIGAAGAARDAAGRNGAGPPAQATPVTSFDITLRPGANLISLPLVPDDIGTEAVLAGILDRVETVWQYDTSGPRCPEWRSYAPEDAQRPEGDAGRTGLLGFSEGRRGRRCGADHTPDGMPRVPARPVVRGWNLVGFTATSPQAPGEYLGALSGSAGTTMVGYAGGTAEVVLPSAAPPQS